MTKANENRDYVEEMKQDKSDTTRKRILRRFDRGSTTENNRKRKKGCFVRRRRKSRSLFLERKKQYLYSGRHTGGSGKEEKRIFNVELTDEQESIFVFYDERGMEDQLCLQRC